jgi:type I restriction enzyme S subunit
VKQGVLERLLTKGIGHTRFKQTEIGEIPESWECRSVRSLLSSSTYGVNVPLETSQASGIPVLRMGNIQDSEIDLSNLKYATLSEQDAQRYDIRSGDILFNRTNSRELVGKVAVARHDISATFASYLIRLRCSSGTDPFWLHAVLSSPKYQDILRSVATPGASQANINANKLGDILVPVPPSEEQKTISGFNDQFRAAEEANCFERQRLEGIKSALMADLLTGRKRVSTALSAAAE